MERRTLLLIASTLVAALGTALVWLYVQGADQRARQTQDLVQVYVSTVSFGANADAGDVKPAVARRSFTRESVEALRGKLVTDPDQITGRTTQPVNAELPLLTAQFGKSGGAPVAPVSLNAKKLAMSVQLADPNRAAGLLQPGSYIAVFAATTGAKPDAMAVLSKVKVLAAEGATGTEAATAQDTTQDTTQGTGRAAADEVPKALVSLEVDEVQAKKLVLAQSQNAGLGTLWFALRGGDDAPVTAGSRSAVTVPDLLEGDPNEGENP
jgi:pilus assembly protein CpaB